MTRAAHRARGGPACVACALVLGLTLASYVSAQESQQPTAPELDWSAWVSDAPMLDLSGEWEFDPSASDPLPEIWSDTPVVYRIVQFNDRVRFEFRPEGGQPTIQTYLWNGSVTRSRRASVEVRERARWTDNGAVFQVEGRRWQLEDVHDVTRFEMRYEIEGRDVLVFRQSDAFGETVWRFAKR